MNFSEALVQMKAGVPICREKWADEKGVLEKTLEVLGKRIVVISDATKKGYVKWVPKQVEIMAEDWEEATDEKEVGEAGA